MALYPLFAELQGREVLVVGGGEVAARKVAALLKSGALVRLHAREVLHPEIGDALAEGRIARLAGEFDPAWLDTAWLVVAATDDVAFNAGLATECGRRRRLINVVDDAALSTFQVPAVVDRAPLVIAISSGGAAPMLARRIRERLETLLDPALGPLAALFGQHRDRIRQRLPDLPARRRWFEHMLDGRMEHAYERAGHAGVEAAFVAELDSAQPAAGGSVTLLVASNAPDLYTLRALRALNEADAIVLAPGVDDAVLEPARRDASRIRASNVEATVERVVQLAVGGARVVYMTAPPLEGGDPACSRIAAACAAASVTCRDIPAVPQRDST